MKLSIIVPILFSLSCLGTASGSIISDVNDDVISSSGGGGDNQPHYVMLNRHLQVATDVSFIMIVYRHMAYAYLIHSLIHIHILLFSDVCIIS